MNIRSSLGAAEAQVAIGFIQSELTRRGKAAVIAVADDHGAAYFSRSLNL